MEESRRIGLGWRRKTAGKAGDRDRAVNWMGLREVARDGQNCGAGASQSGRTRNGGGAIVAVAANVAAALPGNAAIRRHRHLQTHFARLDSGQARAQGQQAPKKRSEEHTSELQSLMRISYAVFCLKKKKK